MTGKSTSNSKNGLANKYRKMTQYEHIVHRPDTYIGSIKPEKDTQYLLHKTETGEIKIKESEIKNIQGLYKIFDEIIVNAIDNKNRIDNKLANGERGLKPMTTLEVNFTRKKVKGLESDKWCIEVKNDGEGIDIEMHPEEKVWIPDMIFGQLLTSSNYDDDEKKITGGKNGFGAKLTNIYSHYFRVETVDRIRKRLYTKEYFNRMTDKEEANIKESFKGKPYTSITFIPYYEAFGLEDLTDELISLFKKRVYDMVYCSYGKIKVILDNEELFSDANSGPAEYIKLYNSNPDIKVFECIPHERWMVSACLSEDFQFRQVSFVNGIYTSRGGKHVDYVSKQICKALSAHIKKKNKIDINEKFIKDNLMIFVNSLIENPDFDGQTKETLKTPPSRFGSKFELPEDFINKIASKSGIIERALAQNSFQDSQLLTRTDGKKTRTLNIPKLDDAEYAGTNKSNKCILILTEGDSAKTSAISGVSTLKDSSKYYGAFPLRGKVLNTRDKSAKDITGNEEIANIKKILGLQENKDYSEDISSLRYGRIMIMTDQDVDGSHIKGLLINYFEHNYPSILKNHEFIQVFVTPIVKVTKAKTIHSFYDLTTYKEWLSKNNDGKGWKVKYYKGLGTSGKAEMKEYFKDPQTIDFKWDETSSEMIDMAFNKKRADDRKKWLSEFKDEVLDIRSNNITYSDFINKELIHFSMYDNVRSIPNLMDGLKPGQRKILYSCFKRNLVNEIKVAQLSGYVSEHAAYHHGEVSLQGTIINMAQDFVGSNNINILRNKGQFGSRIGGGKDSASPRYIFTELQKITFSIYNKHDMALYTYQQDDGQKVEPIFYAPIIPMLLVNGTDGIGTGWSSKGYSFNPLDLVYNIKQKLNNKPLKELIPWYRGFRGTIEKVSRGKWITKGCYDIIDNKTVVISELPIGVWTQKYKDMLITLSQPNKKTGDKLLKSFSHSYNNKDGSEGGDSIINFKLTFEPDVLEYMLTKIDKKTQINEFEKVFNLTSYLTCTNSLNFFDNDNRLQHYTNIDKVFEDYFTVRLELYEKRKEYLISKLTNEYHKTNYKMKFIMAFINDEITIKNVSQEKIYQQLIDLNFPKMDGELFVFPEDKYFAEAKFDYLLNMRISTLTKEKVEELKKENDNIEAELKTLKGKTIKDLWIEDLNEFETLYSDFMKDYYKTNNLNSKDFKINKNKKLSIKINS